MITGVILPNVLGMFRCSWIFIIHGGYEPTSGMTGFWTAHLTPYTGFRNGERFVLKNPVVCYDVMGVQLQGVWFFPPSIAYFMRDPEIRITYSVLGDLRGGWPSLHVGWLGTYLIHFESVSRAEHRLLPTTGNPLARYTLWLFNIAMENSPFIDGLRFTH